MYSELWEILTTFLSFDYPLEILLNLIDRVPSPRAGTNSWLRLIDWDFLINLKKTSETSEKCPRGHLQMFCFVQSKVLDSKCIHFTFRKQERIMFGIWAEAVTSDFYFLIYRSETLDTELCCQSQQVKIKQLIWQTDYKYNEMGSFPCAILLPQTRLAGLLLVELDDKQDHWESLP